MNSVLIPNTAIRNVKFDLVGGFITCRIDADAVRPYLEKDELSLCVSVDHLFPRPDRRRTLPEHLYDYPNIVVADERSVYDSEKYLDKLFNLVKDIDHYIPHITIDSLSCRDGRINRWDGGDDEPTVPAENDERPTFHKDDHGDRTNQKLRVQPFYQRGRDGKPKKW